ncbi:MAG: class I SAM-dependent methyltransferase [Candidatus Omnitrophica bacterium]|nr:class I SAM-dependent methyltransferase [Candidatus Omnitrophota bacterium]MBU1995864.1 class I SAM-dependent methyltransferase [Candidatus Omnitrophota bacterium]MBU4334692.1 class I SAM-dependent methyltransferase [Candidatus Omnitrophota bacterium]
MKKVKKDNNAFWKMRSEHYNELQWAKNNKYLYEFIKAGRFNKKDIVLDVGTGTGIIAHSVAPLVNEVIGMDISQDMLEHSNWKGNLYFIRRDILESTFADGIFDKITCRLVFHHIMRNRQKAMDNCYRGLKKGGMMVLSEGVPPSKRVRKQYVDIFKLKENRVTFYEEDLVGLMKDSGFKNIKVNTVLLKKMSVKNWLTKSGISKVNQEKIYMLHKNATDYFKEDYEMVETENDCLINMKMLILTGKK